jgi:hypothetical protein
LRFISLSLRRTASTPRDARFARLDLGLFTKSSIRITFYEAFTIRIKFYKIFYQKFNKATAETLSTEKLAAARGATLSARKFFLWERLSASIVAAGEPLPQKKTKPNWKMRG